MDKWKDPDWPTPVGAILIIVGLMMQRGTEPSTGLLIGALGIGLLILGLVRRDRAKQEQRATKFSSVRTASVAHDSEEA